ncbi:MAG: endolytic transglycosylase MltG [Bacteroidales bacterium]|nr:endolytic transglycosylase MltG [Bacteroidales bacterium]MBR1795603.1 endolytic transglycosylase MltG [Bacteroidales bacterium]
MEKTVRKKAIWALAAIGLVLALVAGIRLYGAFYDRKMPNFSGTYEFFVRPGMEPSAVVDTLLQSGIVLNARSLHRTLDPLRSMKVGHYTVDRKSSSKYVARMLANGWQTPVNLTLSGTIRTPQVLARKIGNQMLADSAAVAEFALSADSLSRYGIPPSLLFTIVIPDTYQVTWTSSVREIFDRFKKEADAFWTEERVKLARDRGLDPVGVSTLASIVDGETQYGPEQPTVAGVYLNRLRLGMPLQADPTVAFCFDYSLSRILTRHLEVDSPYNTYRYAGLPPGPISCPPKSCLEAVLHAQNHQYLYFCADPSFNGTHRFAATYTEHLNNARAFQRALDARTKK